ncbi:uncharacterized protein IUM83_11707 [Phytophthora cinnamomi]|uniref:uncharacterized protein n=1 Tax=Phytophthora cinnamomi TaxID=4785 RepID=UPI00355ACD9E|nr:hypothetical protein IUM83_11707 [Phytophthora cinnamomi]
MGELKALMPELPTVAVDSPLDVVAAGGKSTLCHEKVEPDMKIVPTAGSLCLSGINCLVLEAPEGVLLLGKLSKQIQLIRDSRDRDERSAEASEDNEPNERTEASEVEVRSEREEEGADSEEEKEDSQEEKEDSGDEDK